MKALTGRAVILSVGIGLAAGCTGLSDAEKKVTASGVRYVDIKEGEGPAAKFGDVVHFTYTARLADGKQYDKRERVHPMNTRVGWGHPIQGVNEGLEGMKVGGVRTLWVPARLAYGVSGSPPNIPPNSDIIYENIELVKITTVGAEEKEFNENMGKGLTEAQKKLQDILHEEAKKEPTGKDVPEGERKEVTLPSGLKYLDLKIGDGRAALSGHQAHVLYVGKLLSGSIFDRQTDVNSPLVFVLGSGKVIKGWEEGIPGMKVGGKRVLYIPSELAYGAKGAGNGKIPPNSPLVFEIELRRLR